VWSTESRQVNCPPVVALTGTVHPIPRSEAGQENGVAISTDECSQRQAHLEKNEDGPLASSHRLTRDPHFFSRFLSTFESLSVHRGRVRFRRREIDKFRGPLRRRHAEHHKGHCGLYSIHAGVRFWCVDADRPYEGTGTGHLVSG
jgi:hypothetical protein